MYQENKYTRIEDYKGFSITAMVVGIVALLTTITVWFSIACGITAIVFAIITLKKSNGQNKKKAIAGLITGIVAVLLAIAALLFYISLGNFFQWLFSMETDKIDDSANLIIERESEDYSEEEWLLELEKFEDSLEKELENELENIDELENI